MKFIKEYIRQELLLEPLGVLTTKEDNIDGLSGESIYIDGKDINLFVAHVDYTNWLEKFITELKY